MVFVIESIKLRSWKISPIKKSENNRFHLPAGENRLKEDLIFCGEMERFLNGDGRVLPLPCPQRD